MNRPKATPPIQNFAVRAQSQDIGSVLCPAKQRMTLGPGRFYFFSGADGSKLRVEVDKTPFPEAVLAVACNIRNKTGVVSNGRF